MSGMGYWVQSESDADKEYWVVPCDHGVWVCNCQDFKQRGGPCKHALAVQLLHECERREAAGPNLVPFPMERYSDTERFILTPKAEAYLSAQEPGPVA
jgi:hypothetical protein